MIRGDQYPNDPPGVFMVQLVKLHRVSAVADLCVCVGVSKRDRHVFLRGKLKMIVGGL